ncbi:MAG: hypothetical protein AB4352_13025 [Hormoscilla sp.]
MPPPDRPIDDRTPLGLNLLPPIAQRLHSPIALLGRSAAVPGVNLCLTTAAEAV